MGRKQAVRKPNPFGIKKPVAENWRAIRAAVAKSVATLDGTFCQLLPARPSEPGEFSPTTRSMRVFINNIRSHRSTQRLSKSHRGQRQLNLETLENRLLLSATADVAAQAGAEFWSPLDGPMATVAHASHLADNAIAMSAPADSPQDEVPDLTVPYVYRYGLTASGLQNDFFDDTNANSWLSRGYLPDKIREYNNGSDVFFSTKWIQVSGARLAWYGMTSAEFDQHYQDLEADWRLVDIDAHNRPNGDVRFAAVWEANPAGTTWDVYRDQTATELDDLIDTLEPLGWVPSRVSAYESNGTTLYISLWEQQSVQWFMYFGQTPAGYQAQINDKIDDFRRLARRRSYEQRRQQPLLGHLLGRSGPQPTRPDRP